MYHKLTKTLFITLLLVGFTSFAVAGEIVFIVNAHGPLVELSKRDIRKVYLGEKRFVGGVMVVPVEQKGDVKNLFLTSFMNMSAKDYRSHWTKKVFREGIQPPRPKDSMREIVDIVRNNTNVIGYVLSKGLTDDKGIKIIKSIKFNK